MLIDSNIIIYAAKPEHNDLRRLIAEHAPAVSAISVVEVLGYHRLTPPERQHFEEFFVAASVLPVSAAVIDHAVRLRQARKMTWATHSSPPPPSCTSARWSPVTPRTLNGLPV